jgi:nucleoside triphosphate pyrophosphatase
VTGQTREQDVKSSNNCQQKLILASSSPRRAEILTAVGWPFEVLVAAVDETIRNGEDPVSYVKRLALAKARAAAEKLTSGLVLGADTTVVVAGEILGQPQDDTDARRMLELLSGKWHEVLTGIALVGVGTELCLVDCERTRVRFAQLSAVEIDWYVSTGEPMGKAGGYGVQGKAALFIEMIEGDYFNVVGLPIQLVYKLATQI